MFGRRRFIDDPDVDLEVSLAVIFADEVPSPLEETSWLAGATFEPLVDTGIIIRATPVRSVDWTNPNLGAIPHAVRRMRLDAEAMSHTA